MNTPNNGTVVYSPLDHLKERIPQFKWTRGVGDAVTSACVNSLASIHLAIQQGVPLSEWTDYLPCIHPALRNFSVGINDRFTVPGAKSDAEVEPVATAWMHKTAPKLLGTASIDNEKLRTRIADLLFNDILPNIYTGFEPGDTVTTRTEALAAGRRFTAWYKAQTFERLATVNHDALLDALVYVGPSSVIRMLEQVSILLLQASSLDLIDQNRIQCFQIALLDNLCEMKNE